MKKLSPAIPTKSRPYALSTTPATRAPEIKMSLR